MALEKVCARCGRRFKVTVAPINEDWVSQRELVCPDHGSDLFDSAAYAEYFSHLVETADGVVDVELTFDASGGQALYDRAHESVIYSRERNTWGLLSWVGVGLLLLAAAYAGSQWMCERIVPLATLGVTVTLLAGATAITRYLDDRAMAATPKGPWFVFKGRIHDQLLVDTRQVLAFRAKSKIIRPLRTLSGVAAAWSLYMLGTSLFSSRCF